jgi:hypothetical protein
MLPLKQELKVFSRPMFHLFNYSKSVKDHKYNTITVDFQLHSHSVDLVLYLLQICCHCVPRHNVLQFLKDILAISHIWDTLSIDVHFFHVSLRM